MASTEEFPARLQRRRQSLTQRIPLKFVGKKCSRTSRLVASSKVLHSAIPTRNCDIIMTLPARTEDSTLMWLLARLRTRTPQIDVHVRHWNNTGVYAFYMTASYEDLLKGAENLSIVKRLKAEVGGGMREFLFEDQNFYEGVHDERNFLSSEERQAIVYHMLLNLRALKGEKFEHLGFLEGQPIVPFLESAQIISQVFPLHNREGVTWLRNNWVKSFCHRQPLDKVCDYFGVKIAMYFAYLGHYTSFLVVPTLVGVVFWLNQGGSQMLEDLFSIAFALFNMLWSSIYIGLWRRRSAELAYQWGTLDKQDELLQDPRPLYKGDLSISPVTGRLEPVYPIWKRNLFRYFITVPVIGFCLGVVFYVMLLIFELQEWVNGLVKTEEIPSFCQFLPKIFLACVIWFLDEVYKKIAFWLNDKENYRMEETYEKHLVIKLVLFQFVNSFLSLFYIAFYLRDMNRLRDTLGALLITRQVIGNIREAVVPYLLWKVKLMKVGYKITGHMSPHTLEKELKAMSTEYAKKTDEKEPGQTDAKDATSEGSGGSSQKSELILTQAELESTMKKYEDTFDDYLEMFIQYGYVILFSSAFPLAALCAFLNNVIEIRSDAFKLCIHHQRPFGKRVRSIGIWLYALRAMGMIAVMVNIALIGVSGQLKRVHPDLDPSHHVIYILAIEHILLLLKVYISYAIPNQPQWIAEEMARLEFQRREALRKLEASPNNARIHPFFQPGDSSPSPSTDVHHTIQPPFIPTRRHTSQLSELHTHSQEQSLITQTSVDEESAELEHIEDHTEDTETTDKISKLNEEEELESRLLPESVESDIRPDIYKESEILELVDDREIPAPDKSCQTVASNVPSEVTHKKVPSSKSVHFQTPSDTCAIKQISAGSYKTFPLTRRQSEPVSAAPGVEATHSVRESRLPVRSMSAYGHWSTKTETRQRILEAVRSRHSDTEATGKKKPEKEKD